jgi:hypothetical protein
MRQRCCTEVSISLHNLHCYGVTLIHLRSNRIAGADTVCFWFNSWPPNLGPLILGQTSTGIIRFLYALFLFPDVSQRVFEEIQSVTQGIRLPHFNDRSQLPYTEAVWKEAARWRTFFPIGKFPSFERSAIGLHVSATKVSLTSLRKTKLLEGILYQRELSFTRTICWSLFVIRYFFFLTSDI